MSTLVQSYDYQPQGRDWIESAGSYAYTQDAVGNVETRTGGGLALTFYYNAFDLPSRITDGLNVTDFAYAADSTRAIKHGPSAMTFYAGDHHQEVQEQTGIQRARSQVFVGGRAIAQVDTTSTGTTSTRYLYGDVLGSVHTTALPDGTVLNVRDYSPFGEQRSASGGAAQTPYGFTGHEHDDDFGLVNMRGRLYDPAIGQFLQADPIISRPYSQGLNRFAYVNNSPLNLVDPSGLAAEENCALGFSDCGALGFPSWRGEGTWETVADVTWYTAFFTLSGFFAEGAGGGLAALVSPSSPNNHGGGGAILGVAKRALDLGNLAVSLGIHGQGTRTTSRPLPTTGSQGSGGQGATPVGKANPNPMARTVEAGIKVDAPLPRSPFALEIPGTPLDVDPNLKPTTPQVTWQQNIGPDMVPEGAPKVRVGNAPNAGPGKLGSLDKAPPNAGHDAIGTLRKELLKELNRGTKALQTQQGRQFLSALQNDGSWVPYVVIGSAAVVAGGTGYLVYRACEGRADCSIEWLE